MATMIRSPRELSVPTTPEVTCLFLDIGGVLLSNGWAHQSRQLAAKRFDLDLSELESRHRLMFETFEEGKLSLDEYLTKLVFYEPRSFGPEEFKSFIFGQSTPYPEMIALMNQLKQDFGLKVFVVSNEAREFNAYRIRTFELDSFVDAFVSSCFVHLRKPDPDIFRVAIDMSQTLPKHILFIDNTAMFVEVAAGFGMQTILHTDYESTIDKLAAVGLTVVKRAKHGG